VANSEPGISRSARVHSQGAATLAGSARAGSLPVVAVLLGAARTREGVRRGRGSTFPARIAEFCYAGMSNLCGGQNAETT